MSGFPQLSDKRSEWIPRDVSRLEEFKNSQTSSNGGQCANAVYLVKMLEEILPFKKCHRRMILLLIILGVTGF